MVQCLVHCGCDVTFIFYSLEDLSADRLRLLSFLLLHLSAGPDFVNLAVIGLKLLLTLSLANKRQGQINATPGFSIFLIDLPFFY